MSGQFAGRWLATALLTTAVLWGCEDSAPKVTKTDAPPAAGGTGGELGSGGSAGNAAGAGGIAGAQGDRLRVGTFNVENLLNDLEDADSSIPDPPVSTAAYQEKLAGVAAILAQLRADVVMLVEVENDAVLADLQSRPELNGVYGHRALVPGNDPRGIDVAVLSKLPLTEVVSHAGERFTGLSDPGGTSYSYARDCLEVHLQAGGAELVLLGVHFKAKVNDNPAKRLAEAEHTRGIANGLLAKDAAARIIVLGDFNDYPATPPMDALYGIQPVAEPRFVSFGSFLPQPDAWTVTSSSAPNGVALHDDLVASPAAAALLVSGGVDILHDDELAEPLRLVSDHAPIVAELDLSR